jgi:hypothetical protein
MRNSKQTKILPYRAGALSALFKVNRHARESPNGIDYTGLRPPAEKQKAPLARGSPFKFVQIA